MTRIFVSYRRDDSAPTTERIVDWIGDAFGRHAVFQDVLSIPAGTDFRRHIAGAIRRSDAQVVVIGPHWLDARDEDGQRRIDQREDSVRVEIETAFAVGTPIVPLLVDGARMPTEEQLPWGLRELAGINALRVRHNPDFAGDMAEVIATIRRVRVSPRRRRLSAELDRLARPGRLRLAELGGLLAVVIALVGVLALGKPGGFLGGTPQPTPSAPPRIDPFPLLDTTLTVDPQGLLAGNPAEIKALQVQVRQIAVLHGHYAAVVYTDAGLASPRQTEYATAVAHAFDVEVLDPLGAHGFVFSGLTEYAEFYNPDLAPNQVDMKIYAFVSRPPGI